ncbi:ABC transporter permease [Mongoliimonas terrestris]|uniref:ABC transporter permease n=1 Tax=Mongoliimonas terrestris TaxID=1709001 RepID=UPI001FD8E2F3|nr:iron ABC transporter permease [Mongoliimonas terrestris]
MPVLVIALLSLLPLARLAMVALAPGADAAAPGFLAVVTSPAALAATWRTLEVSALGMIGALLLGVPAAVAVGASDMPGRRLFALLLILPLMIAPQVTALAYLKAFGPASPLLDLVGLKPPPGTPNPLLGRNGIVLLYAVQHAPLVFLTVRAGLAAIPRDLIEAARVAGASQAMALRTVVLPLLRPHLVAAAALAFVAGIGNFGIPALLGLPVGYTTLPTLIYQQLASSGPRVLPDVAALSVLVGAIAAVSIGLQALALGGRTAIAAGAPIRLPLGRWRVPAAGLAFLVVGAALLVPLAGLVAASLIPTFGVPLRADTVTLSNYVEVLTRQAVTVRAFRNSLLLAGAAALIVAVLAILLARGLDRMPRRLARLIEGIADMPYALPGIVLAIACILIFLKPLPLLGISLYATPWIILFAYLSRFLPLALKPVTAALAALPRELEEAAAAAGARPARRLVTVVVPPLLPAALAGGLLVFLSAFNELTVSALLWSSGTETLGVVLFNLEDGGYGTLAAAIAVATLVVALLVLAVIDRLGRRLPPGVLPWR